MFAYNYQQVTRTYITSKVYCVSSWMRVIDNPFCNKTVWKPSVINKRHDIFRNKNGFIIIFRCMELQNVICIGPTHICHFQYTCIILLSILVPIQSGKITIITNVCSDYFSHSNELLICQSSACSVYNYRSL